MLQRLKEFWYHHTQRIPRWLQDGLITLLLLLAAFWVCKILSVYAGSERNPALIYVLTVTLISLLTNGYFWGIVASICGTFFINYYFMYPYSAFSLSFEGYPVAMVSMVGVSIVVCALTSRVKLQAIEAVKREQNTKALYTLNERLNQEKTTIQLEKDRETIRSNILRAVSHDLRTPLTSISGAASVLLSSAEDRPQRDNILLQDILDDANDLISMVENLLSITRLQEHIVLLNKRPEMLEEVAGAGVMKIRRRFSAAQIQMDLTDDLLYLPMDALLIKQVIINLLENAVRHSGDLEHIRLSLSRQNNWAVITISDRGTGLSPQILRAILTEKPMPRPSASDSTRGMGIGLSVCQSIIKAHGGFFTAENAPEGGAVFRFGLPIEDTEAEFEEMI